jgi:hypothetical protein
VLDALKVPYDTEERKAVEAAFLKEPASYFWTGFPCPAIAGLGAYPFTPGTPVDFFYYPGDFETTHTTTVLDATTTTPTLRWTDGGVVPNASPFKVTIPAQAMIGGVMTNVFVAGRNYMIGVTPTLAGFPVGCPRWMWTPVGTSTISELYATALMLEGSFLKPAAGPSA